MPFLSPYFLVGLAGAAVPVVIHLLIRDHLRRVEFSTLRFFVKTSRLALRRKRLREMLLVALRAAVCALLAVAFARPFIRGEEIGDDPGKLHARTARVIVADVSGSMARGGAAEALRAEARKAVESLSAGADAVAVVSFDQAARVEAPLSRQFALAARAVEALTPGQGGTNIPQALRVADAELSQAYATTREIVLISDLQRSGWRELREDFLAKKLSPGTRLVVRPIRPGGDGHVAIAGGSAPDTAVLDREPISVSVRIANYSDPGAPGEGVAVRLKLGDEAQTRKVNLRAGGMAAATFRPVLTTPGDHPGTITVATGQGSADDVFYFNTRVIPKIKVLVLDGPARRDRGLGVSAARRAPRPAPAGRGGRTRPPSSKPPWCPRRTWPRPLSTRRWRLRRPRRATSATRGSWCWWTCTRSPRASARRLRACWRGAAGCCSCPGRASRPTRSQSASATWPPASCGGFARPPRSPPGGPVPT